MSSPKRIRRQAMGHLKRTVDLLGSAIMVALFLSAVVWILAVVVSWMDQL